MRQQLSGTVAEGRGAVKARTPGARPPLGPSSLSLSGDCKVPGPSRDSRNGVPNRACPAATPGDEAVRAAMDPRIPSSMDRSPCSKGLRRALRDVCGMRVAGAGSPGYEVVVVPVFPISILPPSSS